MTDSSLQACIDALPSYIDRDVLAQILSRIPSEDQVTELLRGLKDDMPSDGPGSARDFSVGFRVKGDKTLAALFDRLIIWR